MHSEQRGGLVADSLSGAFLRVFRGVRSGGTEGTLNQAYADVSGGEVQIAS